MKAGEKIDFSLSSEDQTLVELVFPSDLEAGLYSSKHDVITCLSHPTRATGTAVKGGICSDLHKQGFLIQEN